MERRETNEQLNNAKEAFVMRWWLQLGKARLTFPQMVILRMKSDSCYFSCLRYLLLDVLPVNISKLQNSINGDFQRNLLSYLT